MPYKSKEVQREYQRKWVAERRRKWLAENGPCARCGSDEDLEVDHIDKNEKIDHKVWSWAEERMLAELSKCQVLCKKCHTTKTVTEGQQPKHGTQNMYQYYKCRCTECVKAKVAANKKYLRA